jgi:hypothetical protein
VWHWQVLFKEIADQLLEIEMGRNPIEEIKFDNFQDTEQERKQKQVMTEPQMELSVSSSERCLRIDYVNVASVRVAYYPIDMEVLFSKSPFMSKESHDECSFV